jgi:hypothetical protein
MKMYLIAYFDERDEERFYARFVAPNYNDAVRQLKEAWEYKIIFHEKIK